MVVVHLKRREGNEFLFTTTANVELSVLIPQLVEIHNLRVKIEELANNLETLANAGKEEKGYFLLEDQLRNTLDKAIAEARVFLSPVRG